MGGVGSGPKSSASLQCSRPGHEDSRVKFDGTYGPPRHRRQRYKCVPANGDKPHRFTDPLPREEAWHDDCEYCERNITRHQGPHAARNYQFVARGIAGALRSVGEGATYMDAAGIARERAKRERIDPVTLDLRPSKHGQLVADWVEVFAPVVFEPHRPNDWPSEGTLVLDHMPFRIKSLKEDGTPNPGGKVAFDVFAAMSYNERGEPKLWRLEAFNDASARNWTTFLSRLAGEPPRVVCDNHTGMTSAIRSLWPQTDLYLSEWHLINALRKILRKAERSGNVASVAGLQAKVGGSMVSRAKWNAFVTEARAAGIVSLDRWLDKMDPVVRSQLDRRAHRAYRGKNMPLTTGGLEGKLKPLKHAIAPRVHVLRNRERLNRLLMLMQLHSNGDDHQTAYTKAIRQWLEVNNGRPIVPRRAITDPADAPSLGRR